RGVLGRTTPGRCFPAGSRGWRLPKRPDIRSVCLIGSGPIVIGQACEFDYAGCQALKVLREDGFRTIVVNSNPATIMTDPGFADRTYLEPLNVHAAADVLRRGRRARCAKRDPGSFCDGPGGRQSPVPGAAGRGVGPGGARPRAARRAPPDD